MIEAALETVKFSRPPTPIAPLAQAAAAAPAPAPEEQFFEPTGEAARHAAPVTLHRTPSRGGLGHGIPSGGFSIQRPPHEANIRLSPSGIALVPARRTRAVRLGAAAVIVAVAAVLGWLQFGPARAAEFQDLQFPDVTRDNRAIDVPVVARTDSAAPKEADSVVAGAPEPAATTSSPPTTTPLAQPNARISNVRPDADSARLAAAAPPGGARPARPDSVSRGGFVPPPAITPTAPVVPSINFPPHVGTLAAGMRHSCALTDGRAACWGSNDNGQLGDGSFESRPTPELVASDLTFTEISSGLTHTCGLTTTNEVFCWGANNMGQLGDATTQPRTAPVRINSTVSFRFVSAGRDHTCGVSQSRRVLCWGSNSNGQVGDGGSRQRRSSPAAVEIPGSLAVAALAVGWDHSCALTVDGAAWCWGKNDFGQLGDGTTGTRLIPIRVPHDGPFVSIAAGAVHTCAITVSGEAWCWGRNNFGQLGSGGIAQSPTPRIVSSGTQFSTIVAGGFFTCGRGRDSNVYCWGSNSGGQLGDGTTQNRTVPARVSGLTRVSSLSAGGGHACATSGSETYCWGNNVDGQVSKGDRDPATSPIRVLIPPR